MIETRKTMKTWVMVADGFRAKIYENTGHGSGLSRALDHDFAAPAADARQVYSDAPGRAFDSPKGGGDIGGQGRHAMEPSTDWKEQAKQDFAKDMAAELNKAAAGNRYDRLVLVAPPKALGDLRANLDKPAAEKLYAEVNKDYTHFGPADLEKHLAETMPV